MFAAPGKTGCLIRNASIYGVVSVPRLTALLSRNTLLCILWICSRYVDENLFSPPRIISVFLPSHFGSCLADHCVCDLLQTRMQVLNPSSGGLYTGLTNAFSTIYRIEGWRTLWKGVSSVIVGAGMTRESWCMIFG